MGGGGGYTLPVGRVGNPFSRIPDTTRDSYAECWEGGGGGGGGTHSQWVEWGIPLLVPQTRPGIAIHSAGRGGGGTHSQWVEWGIPLLVPRHDDPG